MSVTYSLKDPQTNIKPSLQKATPILLTYHFQGTRMKIGVGESLKPADWNQRTGRPRASAPGSATLTVFLDRLADKVREVHLRLKAEFVLVTPAVLKQELQRDIQTGGKRENLVQFFTRLIEEKKKKNSVKNIGMYNSVLKMLKSYPGPKDFADITPEWFVKYQTYMENHRSDEILNGYSANYISRQITAIREIMTIAKRAGLHRNDKYNDKAYKKPSEAVESIYLTIDELMSIYTCELPDHLDKVRNRFIIGAFTGLRFSDSAKITHESIREGMLYDRNIKTGANVVVPIHDIVTEIMNKYPDGLPPSLSNQKSNDALKVIGEIAKIDTPIIRNQIKGGKLITTTLPKWNFITTHTGRRSFATNAVLAGLPEKAVRMITGHKTQQSFEKYLKMNQQESAQSIKDHPFFTKPTAQ